MADMIIKPSDGNDLVIQGGDNSPAITVGNTGTTTFAENTTLSGSANNLGTVTAGTLASGVTGGSGLTAVGFPFTSGYQNIGDYRFLFGSGVFNTQESSYTNGSAGTNYYGGTGLSVALSGFSSVIGAIGTMNSAYVETNVTVGSLSTSSVQFQPSSPRGNASWASPYKVMYVIWGVAS